LLETARITCMIFMIITCALLFAHLITLMRIPLAIAEFVAIQQVPAWAFWIFIVILVGIEGCFLDAAGILYVTVPVFFPVLKVLNIDSIHFGIVMILLIELGMITPPAGMNLFVIMGLRPGTTLVEVSRGAIPFMVLILAYTFFVILFPILSLWIPGLMK
jgi:C4-dicarboxylate transporter, DctM subunit